MHTAKDRAVIAGIDAKASFTQDVVSEVEEENTSRRRMIKRRGMVRVSATKSATKDIKVNFKKDMESEFEIEKEKPRWFWVTKVRRL